MKKMNQQTKIRKAKKAERKAAYEANLLYVREMAIMLGEIIGSDLGQGETVIWEDDCFIGDGITRRRALIRCSSPGVWSDVVFEFPETDDGLKCCAVHISRREFAVAVSATGDAERAMKGARYLLEEMAMNMVANAKAD